MRIFSVIVKEVWEAAETTYPALKNCCKGTGILATAGQVCVVGANQIVVFMCLRHQLFVESARIFRNAPWWGYPLSCYKEVAQMGQATCEHFGLQPLWGCSPISTKQCLAQLAYTPI